MYGVTTHKLQNIHTRTLSQIVNINGHRTEFPLFQQSLQRPVGTSFLIGEYEFGTGITLQQKGDRHNYVLKNTRIIKTIGRNYQIQRTQIEDTIQQQTPTQTQDLNVLTHSQIVKDTGFPYVSQGFG